MPEENIAVALKERPPLKARQRAGRWQEAELHTGLSDLANQTPMFKAKLFEKLFTGHQFEDQRYPVSVGLLAKRLAEAPTEHLEHILDHEQTREALQRAAKTHVLPQRKDLGQFLSSLLERGKNEKARAMVREGLLAAIRDTHVELLNQPLRPPLASAVPPAAPVPAAPAPAAPAPEPAAPLRPFRGRPLPMYQEPPEPTPAAAPPAAPVGPLEIRIRGPEETTRDRERIQRLRNLLLDARHDRNATLEALVNLERHYQERISQEHGIHTQELQTREDAHRQAMEQQRTEHEELIDRWRQRLDVLRKDHTQDKAKLERRLTEEHRQALATVDQENERIRDGLIDAQGVMQRRHEEETERLQREIAGHIQDKAGLEREREERTAFYRKTIREMEQEADQLGKQLQAAIPLDRHQKIVEAQRKTQEAELKRKEARIANLQKQLDEKAYHVSPEEFFEKMTEKDAEHRRQREAAQREHDEAIKGHQATIEDLEKDVEGQKARLLKYAKERDEAVDASRRHAAELEALRKRLEPEKTGLTPENIQSAGQTPATDPEFPNQLDVLRRLIKKTQQGNK